MKSVSNQNLKNNFQNVHVLFGLRALRNVSNSIGSIGEQTDKKVTVSFKRTKEYFEKTR